MVKLLRKTILYHNSITWLLSNKLLIWILLTLSWRRPLSYRNQSVDLLPKSMDWFLYGNGLRHERVNGFIITSRVIEYFSVQVFSLFQVCQQFEIWFDIHILSQKFSWWVMVLVAFNILYVFLALKLGSLFIDFLMVIFFSYLIKIVTRSFFRPWCKLRKSPICVGSSCKQ